MTYTVKYRIKGNLLWNTVKNVRGDVLPSDMPGFKILIIDTEEQFHIPLEGTEFWFSKERYISIKQSMEKEAGQSLK